MNENKFCFIICTNNDVFLEECVHYINNLLVPDGYEIDLISISEAACMTEGYNEGMHMSDAKYKIYMHQDVFILNKFFLQNLLDIFASDKEIGMIGMVGYETIANTGMMWDEKRYGSVFYKQEGSNYMPISEYRYSVEKDGYRSVALIDGLLVATCVDIEWNTEDLTGWDFYDVYHSLEFIEHGYKVVVPVQQLPWVMHDDGVILNFSNYDKFRQLFLKKYKEYLGKNVNELRTI